ncbi:hypothetical protein AKJ16_DCAP06968 [Drosera capensis]
MCPIRGYKTPQNRKGEDKEKGCRLVCSTLVSALLSFILSSATASWIVSLLNRFAVLFLSQVSCLNPTSQESLAPKWVFLTLLGDLGARYQDTRIPAGG